MSFAPPFDEADAVQPITRSPMPGGDRTCAGREGFNRAAPQHFIRSATWPQLMFRYTAAAYCTPPLIDFDTKLAADALQAPTRFQDRARWSRHEIDRRRS